MCQYRARRCRLSMVFAAIIVGFTLARSTVHAAIIAADDSSGAAYSSGWTAGTNGGFGFTPWQFSGPFDNDPSHGGYFIGDSTTNGGSGTGAPGSSGGINVAGNSWGLYANYDPIMNSGQIADARRQFSEGDLLPGQSFAVSFDNGWIDNDGTTGIALQNGVLDNRFEFFFHVGDAQYTINDAAGPHFANFNWTDSGIIVQFTLVDAVNYVLELTPAGGGVPVFDAGQLLNSPGVPDIDNFRVYNSDAGDGTAHDFFINSMSITPEPANLTVLALGASMLARRKRGR